MKVIPSPFPTVNRRLLAIIALAYLFLAVFWPVWPAMISTWLNDPESSHCLLIPFVSAFLIWRKRSSWSSVTPKPSLLGLGVLIGGLLVYVLSLWGGMVVGQRLGLVMSLQGIILYNLGQRFFRLHLFSFLFLFLMIPIPISVFEAVSFPMQLFATTCSKHLIAVLGIPVSQTGNVLHIPEGALEVVAACSGIRSLLSFFTLSLLFAHWRGSKPLEQAILVLSTVPIALGVNILRITSGGVVGHFFGMELASGFLHDFSGFALFFTGLALFVLETKLLSKYVTRDLRISKA